MFEQEQEEMDEQKLEDADFPDIPLTSLMSYNFQVLQFFGYWPITEKLRTWKTLTYRIYSYFMLVFSFYFYMIAETLEMLRVFGNIEAMIDSSFLLLTHIAEACKIFYWLKYQAKIKDLLHWLDGDMFKEQNCRQHRILIRAIGWYRNFYKVFMSMGCATCILWAIFPQFNREERNLPLKTWSPFKKTETPGYEITYTYQMFAVWVNAMVNITFDSTAAALMMIITVQLDYLNDSLLNIRQDSVEIVAKRRKARGVNEQVTDRRAEGVGQMVETAENFISHGLIFSQEMQIIMNARLIRCINHHKAILKFVSVVRDLFSFSVLMQFVVSTIIVCITMFKLTLVPLFTLEFISLTLYQGCMLFELFCYCWFGNEIILGSGKLSQSAYLSHWYGGGKDYMKKLLFFMICTKEPMKLYAGGFFTLSVETFMKILKSSWSYFAVLQNVNS